MSMGGADIFIGMAGIAFFGWLVKKGFTPERNYEDDEDASFGRYQRGRPPQSSRSRSSGNRQTSNVRYRDYRNDYEDDDDSDEDVDEVLLQREQRLQRELQRVRSQMRNSSNKRAARY